MELKKIIIENYRGIREKQEILLSSFTSIVGKNDSGKSIILNAIATFLDPKNYPIVKSDFNNPNKPIVIECHFYDENLKGLLEDKLKSKVRKNDGLEDFIDDILYDRVLIIRKTATGEGKKFNSEEILIQDFENDAFSMLYTKKDEEITNLIDKYGIEIPVQGKGRNSKLEKIKYLKQYCEKNNIGRVKKYISDVYKLTSILPGVELFVSDYGLKPDTSFKTQAVSEIMDYFDTATVDGGKLKEIENDIIREMNKEAEEIKKYMLDYTQTLKRVEIMPNIVWKDAIRSVDVSFQFDGDTRTIPMSHKGTGYRRLFMVARFRYLATKNKGNNIIYLIEEPEAFLHPSAQMDLLNALKELSNENQIIVTTHSPVFAGATDYYSIVLCRKEEQSIYEFITDDGDKEKFIENIIKELGIKPYYNLRDKFEKILFVESANDAKFYDIISQKVLGKKLLSNEIILVLHGGGSSLNTFVNIDYFKKSGRELFLLIDSDKGNERQSDRQSELLNDFKGNGYKLKKRTIENYYHPRAIERVYRLEEGTFDFFSDDENVKNKIKSIVAEKNIGDIKVKNNMQVFENMTKEEWKEVLEKELIDFLEQLLD